MIRTLALLSFCAVIVVNPAMAATPDPAILTAQAEAGNAAAMFNLGALNSQGVGLPKDDAQAVLWWRKAADAGIPQAMFNLGLFYSQGRGAPKDDAAAVELWRKAAELGEPNAMQNYAASLSAGTGTAKDQALALAWYKKAAEAGMVASMDHLGEAYENGDNGAPQDSAEAEKWWGMAADRGDATAAYLLGLHYLASQHADRLTQATVWLTKAKTLGAPSAQSTLDGIKAGKFDSPSSATR